MKKKGSSMGRKMFEDLKILGLLVLMALASAFIRFRSLTQFFTDAVLGFVMGYSFYMLLSLWINDGATRSGFCGIIICLSIYKNRICEIIIVCSRPLYDWANFFIRNKLNEIIDKKVNK